MGFLLLLATLTTSTAPAQSGPPPASGPGEHAPVDATEDVLEIRSRLAHLQSELVGAFMVALGKLEDTRAAMDALLVDEPSMGVFARLLTTSRALADRQSDQGMSEIAESFGRIPPALLPAMRDALALIPLARALMAGHRPVFTAQTLMRTAAVAYDTSRPVTVTAGFLGALLAPLAMIVHETAGPNLSDERRTELESLANVGMHDGLRLFVAIAEDRGLHVPAETLPAAERFNLAHEQARHDERLAALFEDVGS